MKFVIVLALAVACALAAPVDDKNAEIVSQNADIDPSGTFVASYKTSNGISAEEKGVLAEARDEKNNVFPYLARSGTFSYVDPQGGNHQINWVADSNGYRAEGADIPQAP